MSGGSTAVRRSITGGLSFGELARRVWREIQDDQVGNKAAELAYYFTLAFFPLLIFLITLLAILPGAPELILGYLDSVLPQEAQGVIHTWMQTIFNHGTGTLLSVSLLFTLWSASAGVAALIDVFNVAYEVREQRPYWKYRLTAIALTVGIALLVLGGALIFTFGSVVLDWLAAQLHLGAAAVVLGKIINAMIGLGMLFAGISMLHSYGPNTNQRFGLFSPGSVLTVIGILFVSQIFSAYLKIAPRYDAVYGGIGAIVIFMLWQYLIGFVLVVGAEVNDEVRKAAGERPRESEGPGSRDQGSGIVNG